MQKYWIEGKPASVPALISPSFTKRMTGLTVLALASFFIGTLPCRAQTDNQASATAQTAEQPNANGTVSAEASTAQPENVRVVRLSDVEGMVQIQRGNEVQFSQAVMNMPLMQGSRINTGADGRAEIEFEDGSVVRITPNSSLVLSRLEAAGEGDLKTTTEQLAGLIYYELRSDPRTSYEVTFGNRTITPTVNSTFRIDMAAATPAVAVIDGRVQVKGSADSYLAEVKQGQAINFPSSGKYTIADGILPNGFDEWNDQRDQEAQQQAQNQTPAREQGGGSIMDGGLGWSDLDSYGGWYPLPGYGMVWQPYGVGADFDPYGSGAWANFGGAFGYTWVSGYPWGWLPFHCGGWSYIGSFGWGWTPGPYGCGGYGIGFGWHGGVYWRNAFYPHTNIYRGPNGYRAPAPPHLISGQTGPRMVHVGNGSALAGAALRSGHGDESRTAKFNGQKIAPLHSTMAGVHVPMRNAALYNNYPRGAFQGNVRDSLLNHSAGGQVHGTAMTHGGGGLGTRGLTGTGRNVSQSRPGGTTGMYRSPMSASRMQAINTAHGQQFGQHSFGAGNQSGFGQQRSSFGPRGGFNNAHYSGSGSGYHGGGTPGSGYRGGAAGGGYRGSGAASGGHAGGGISSGGGMSGGHGGGGFSGGGGGHTGH